MFGKTVKWLGQRIRYQEIHRYDSTFFRFHITTLGKLFTHATCLNQCSLAVAKENDAMRLVAYTQAWRKVRAADVIENT